MPRHLLFVFGTQGCIPERGLLAARDLGLHITVFGQKLTCCMSESMFDRFERVRLEEPEAVLEAARRLNAYQAIDGVMAYDDQGVPLAAQIATELGLPGQDPESAMASRDKALMKERFTAAGVPIAPYRLAENEDDAVAWAKRQGYPVVVKPTCGAGSQGVIRADDEEQLRQAYRRTRLIVREHGLETNGRPDSQLLVEGYLDGQEYSVELLIRNGEPHVLCVFEKPHPLTGPYFEESLYVTPPRLSAERVGELGELAKKSAAALGLHSGAAHCEIRSGSGGDFILETGGRLIGGACSQVFDHVIEGDIHEYLLRLALGEEIEVPLQEPGRHAGAMMLPVPCAGRLVAMRGVEEARQVPGIQNMIVNCTPGEVFVPYPEQSCYKGFLTATGETFEDVEKSFSMAAEKIEFGLTPLECETWIRSIGRDANYRAPAEQAVYSLAQSPNGEVENTILPLVASTQFGQLPDDLAHENARKCLDCLAGERQGSTAADLWIVAEDRGVVLGSVRDDGVGYLSMLGVLPESRRTGLGEVLVRSLMAAFAERGCNRVETLVDPRQPASVSLYEKLGFEPADVDEECMCCEC